MKLAQLFKQAFDNIINAKLRSFLAVLGILVGTASVVALVSSGESATEKALEQFKALGTDLLSVSLYQRSNSASSAGHASDLSLKEIQAMPKKIPDIKEIAPYTTLYASINYDGHKVNASMVGVTNTLQDVIKIKVQKGRFISFLDHYSYFCVIGNNIYQQIKKYNPTPLGSQLQVGANYFTIIGIASKWPENSFFNEDVNSLVIIPINMSSVIAKNSSIRNMVMTIKPNSKIDPLIKSIKKHVAQHAPKLNVFIRSAKQIISSMKNQSQIFTLLLGMIGSISLLVGGIGVMNVMLVSVAERRREIGIRKAIGARRSDIQNLFLSESIVLALFGGIVGVITGILASFIIAYFASWDFRLFILPPVIGFFVSAATGIFFGFYPAYRASKLNPIDTLRYD